MAVVKRTLISVCLLYQIQLSFAQSDTALLHQLNRPRLLFVAAANGALYSGTFIALNRAWYTGYAKTGFHFFNDNPEWNQMDKLGHIWSTYQVSRSAASMWKWAGISAGRSALLGVVNGMVFQGIVEMQDAYSAQWGFSWGDVGANVLGAGLYLSQQVTWNEQRVQIKLSHSPYRYPEALKQRRDELFGNSVTERILKDYNEQTYWGSANISSFFPRAGIPRWLNLALGYSAEGMYGGRINKWTDEEGANFDYSHIKRERRFYLSPDIDLTRIQVRSRWLRSMLFVVNAVKIPAPALEWRSGKLALRIR